MVRVRDLDQEPSARVAFMKEPKVGRGEAPQAPICNLNITLPDMLKVSTTQSGIFTYYYFYKTIFFFFHLYEILCY